MRGVRAERRQHHQERHEQRGLQIREPDELIEEQERHRDGNDVGEDNDPDHRVGDVQVPRQHRRPGHEPLEQEHAQENRHRDAARNPKGDGRDEVPALARIIHGARRQHAFDVALAECLGMLRGVLRVRVGDELRDRAAHPWNHTDAHPDRTRAKRQPPVLERVADALHDARDPPVFPAPRDAVLRHHQLEHFGAAEQSHHHRHHADAFPQVQLPEREARDAALRIEADHREQEPKGRHQEPLDQVPSRQRHDEAQAEHRQHQELGRSQLQHDRPNHRHRDRQYHRAHERADE